MTMKWHTPWNWGSKTISVFNFANTFEEHLLGQNTGQNTHDTLLQYRDEHCTEIETAPHWTHEQ